MNKLFLWAYWICFENLCQVVIKSLVLYLGCVCFGWKSLPEMLFQKWGCFVGLENSIFRKMKSVDKKKKPLTTEIILHFYFPFKVFPENERERESAHAIVISSPRRSWSRRQTFQSSLIAISQPDRDCDLTFARLHRIEIAVDAILPSRDRTGLRSLSMLREIAPSIAISRRRWDRDRDLGSRLTARSSDGAIWVMACVFLDLCFPSSFPNTRKYFSENFLKRNQTPWKHFPFPEISISGKYVFSGKRFTATKHSLSH